MAEKYLVSFGESERYITGDHKLIELVTDRLRDGMKKEFPALNPDSLLHRKVVKTEHADRYEGYDELSIESIPEILQVLVNTQKNKSDQQQLDLNAPFADVNAN